MPDQQVKDFRKGLKALIRPNTVTTQASYSIPIHSYAVPKQLAPFLSIPKRSYSIPIQCNQDRNSLGTFLYGSYAC